MDSPNPSKNRELAKMVTYNLLIQADPVIWDGVMRDPISMQCRNMGLSEEEITQGWDDAFTYLEEKNHPSWRKYQKMHQGKATQEVDPLESVWRDFVTGGVQVGDEATLETRYGEVRLKISELLSFRLFQAKVAEYASIVYPSAFAKKHEDFVAGWLKLLRKMTMVETDKIEHQEFVSMFNEFLAEKTPLDKKDVFSHIKNGTGVGVIDGEILFKESLLRRWLAQEDFSFDWKKKKVAKMLKEVFGDALNRERRINNIRLYAIKQNHEKIQHDGGSGEDDAARGDIHGTPLEGDTAKGDTRDLILQGDGEGASGAAHEEIPF